VTRPGQPHPGDPVPDGGEQIAIDRATLEAAAELIAAGHDHDERIRRTAYEAGRQAHLDGGYPAGYILGHDTGLSARQDARGYVHGILDGFRVGCQERHQLAAGLLHRGPATQADHQADREAEAG
jgi:hypothetical protein